MRMLNNSSKQGNYGKLQGGGSSSKNTSSFAPQNKKASGFPVLGGKNDMMLKESIQATNQPIDSRLSHQVTAAGVAATSNVDSRS